MHKTSKYDVCTCVCCGQCRGLQQFPRHYTKAEDKHSKKEKTCCDSNCVNHIFFMNPLSNFDLSPCGVSPLIKMSRKCKKENTPAKFFAAIWGVAAGACMCVCLILVPMLIVWKRVMLRITPAAGASVVQSIDF